MGAGGVIVPPEGYFEAIAAVCRPHDVLMISDEVICGFGRTGEWFGAETLGFEPNAISMAKQLTAGFLPLSAVAIDGGMAEVIEANSGRIGTLGHGYTYGGHPVACAVGVKALEIYERIDAPGRVRAAGARLRGAPPSPRRASARRRGARPRADGRARARAAGARRSPCPARSARGSPPSFSPAG